MEKLFGGSQGNELQLLRQFRDKRLAKTPAGLMLTNLYYQHSEEAGLLLERNPRLAAAAKKLIVSLLPALSAGITADRDIVLTKAQRTAVMSLLQMIQEHSSPALGKAVSRLIRLSGFRFRDP